MIVNPCSFINVVNEAINVGSHMKNNGKFGRFTSQKLNKKILKMVFN